MTAFVTGNLILLLGTALAAVSAAYWTGPLVRKLRRRPGAPAVDGGTAMLAGLILAALIGVASFAFQILAGVPRT